MFNIANIFRSKKEVSIDLAENVQLVVTPATAGGAHAAIIETTGIFIRQERCYFGTVEELIKSLRLTDEKIIKKLSKAF